MNISKDFIKDMIGYIIMITIVFGAISCFGVKDWSSYIIGLCIGFGMPMFTMFWNKITEKW